MALTLKEMSNLPHMPYMDVHPDWGLVDDGEFVLDKVTFGDGFIMRAPKGVNSARRSWQLNWGLLDKKVAYELRDFFVSLKGSYPFLWAHPETGEAIAAVAAYPKLTLTEYGNYELSVSIEEDF